MCVLNKIIELLKTQNKKQKDLTDYLGLTKNTFTNWKAGNNQSYKKYLPQIAEFFNVSIDYLLGKEKNKTPGNNAEGIIYPSYDEPSILMLHDEPNLPFKTEPEDIILTAKEIRLIKAYRTKLEMRNSVDILLGINEQPDLTEDMAETVNKTAFSPINKN